MTKDYSYFKSKLEAEKKLVEKELTKVGRRNPDNLSDWEATPPGGEDAQQADDNVAADRIEDYEGNLAIVNTLENRYQDIKNALDRIERDTYGVCRVCKKEISVERLEANPSADTCREHME